MKGTLAPLALLIVYTAKVCSLPYQADSTGKCRNPDREYLSEVSNLCCKRCPPGWRLKQACSERDESLCEPCTPGSYMESWNYAQNCISCAKCKTVKGLQNAQNCSTTSRSTCKCQAGMYCVIQFGRHCTECQKYSACRAGYGVSVPGTANSDVKCEKCPDGTFSDTVSATDACRPHTHCQERAVVSKGTLTSDTVCDSRTSLLPPTSNKHHTETVQTTSVFFRSTASATTEPSPSYTFAQSTIVASSDFKVSSTYPTTSPVPSTGIGYEMVAAIAGVIMMMFLIFIIAILLVRCKPVWKRDTAKFPEVDANGNCESDDKISQGYLGETQLTSFTVISAEQQCLLQNGGTCNEHSQCSSTTATLSGAEGCDSHDSIGPLKSTTDLHSPHSALSESHSMLSHTNHAIAPQPSIPMQSPQSASPCIISPVTTSPHVNVNINFHIGNGSCGTPSITPADLMQTDSQLPFGETEECISIPQQEAGKQSVMSVQESASYPA